MGQEGSASKAGRIGLEIIGWLLLAAGVAALVLPGPGLLLLALGLWVLAKNYRWADRLLDPVKRAAYRAAAESVTSWPRIILSTLLALALIGVGVFWGVRPAPARSRRGATRYEEVGFSPAHRQASHLLCQARADEAQYQQQDRSRRSEN